MLRWFPARLAGVVPFFALAACSGPGTNLDNLIDASLPVDGGLVDVGGDGTAYANAFAGAPSYTMMTPDATTELAIHPKGINNIGLSCITSSCHGATATTPLFVGGTVFQDYYGQTTAGLGIELRLVDTMGHAQSSYTDPNGNFFLRTKDAAGLTFPLAVGIRNSSNARPMVVALTSSQGSCAQTNCHAIGGNPEKPGTGYFPIHLP
jgi:hypothetical protein